MSFEIKVPAQQFYAFENQINKVEIYAIHSNELKMPLNARDLLSAPELIDITTSTNEDIKDETPKKMQKCYQSLLGKRVCMVALGPRWLPTGQLVPFKKLSPLSTNTKNKQILNVGNRAIKPTPASKIKDTPYKVNEKPSLFTQSCRTQQIISNDEYETSMDQNCPPQDICVKKGEKADCQDLPKIDVVEKENGCSLPKKRKCINAALFSVQTKPTLFSQGHTVIEMPQTGNLYNRDEQAENRANDTKSSMGSMCNVPVSVSDTVSDFTQLSLPHSIKGIGAEYKTNGLHVPAKKPSKRSQPEKCSSSATGPRMPFEKNVFKDKTGTPLPFLNKDAGGSKHKTDVEVDMKNKFIEDSKPCNYPPLLRRSKRSIKPKAFFPASRNVVARAKNKKPSLPVSLWDMDCDFTNSSLVENALFKTIGNKSTKTPRKTSRKCSSTATVPTTQMEGNTLDENGTQHCFEASVEQGPNLETSVNDWPPYKFPPYLRCSESVTEPAGFISVDSANFLASSIQILEVSCDEIYNLRKEAIEGGFPAAIHPVVEAMNVLKKTGLVGKYENLEDVFIQNRLLTRVRILRKDKITEKDSLLQHEELVMQRQNTNVGITGQRMTVAEERKAMLRKTFEDWNLSEYFNNADYLQECPDCKPNGLSEELLAELAFKVNVRKNPQ